MVGVGKARRGLPASITAWLGSGLLVATLAGCSWYEPAPLPNGADLAPGLPVQGPVHPLDMTEVATLAVRQNPDLVASRRKVDVAEAQAFVAGLLPNPQLTASVDHPTLHGYVNGYAYGLAEDLQALLLQPSKAAAGKAARDQAKLGVLWDEWQTVAKAGALYAQKYFADEKSVLLANAADVLSQQADHSGKALEMGDTTIDQAGSDLAAALDVASQRDAARRDAVGADTDLKALLGLAPQSELALAALPDPETIGKEEVAAALQGVAKLRPDLLALQAGYNAQEEAVYQAVLSQFPAITLGANRQADTSNVHTTGLSVTVNLPLFDFGQGEIQIQSATRAQLRAEYQARLDQTTSDAWKTWRQSELLRDQIAQLTQKLPALRMMAEQSRTAYRSGNLAAATYVVMQTSLVAREGELLDLKASLWADTLALRTLLGMSYAEQPAPEKPS
jgi:outer membrane protein TolC